MEAIYKTTCQLEIACLDYSKISISLSIEDFMRILVQVFLKIMQLLNTLQ